MATIRTTLQLYDRMSRPLQQIETNISGVISRLKRLESVSRNLGGNANTAGMRAEMDRLRQEVDRVNEEMRQLRENQDRLNGSIRQGTQNAGGLLSAVRQIGGAYLGIRGAGALVGLSDQMASTEARLNLIVDDGGSVDELEQKIFASAQRSRADYMSTAAAVSKLGIVAGKAFSGNDEIIRFTELMNKNFKIAGASASEASAAMYQLNQAFGAGKLQGDEYRSIIENAPLLAQSIEDYMRNVVKAEGAMKDWSSAGMLTPQVIKAALFSAADEIEERFAQMPMTWGDVWTGFKNNAIMALQPLLDAINWMANHFDQLLPVVAALTGAVIAFAAGQALSAAATWLNVEANRTLIATMLANPFTWIAVVIGVIIYMFVLWAQSVGGLRVAWLITVDQVLYYWDLLKIGFMTGLFAVQNMLDKIGHGFNAFGTALVNYIGDTKVDFLNLIQTMVNGAIDIINGFIEKLNHLPGVSLDVIEHVTFAAEAAAENEAAKEARNNELRRKEMAMQARATQREQELRFARSDWQHDHQSRLEEIERVKVENEKNQLGIDPSLYDSVGAIEGNTAKSADSLEISEEDLKYMRDIAEREAVNRFTTAEIRIDQHNENHIASGMDVDGIMNTWTAAFVQEMNISAEGVHL